MLILTSQLNYIRHVRLEAALHIDERFESMHSRLLSIAVGTQQAQVLSPSVLIVLNFYLNIIVLHYESWWENGDILLKNQILIQSS